MATSEAAMQYVIMQQYVQVKPASSCVTGYYRGGHITQAPSTISRLLPKTEAELRSWAMTGYRTSKRDITGFYPIMTT